MRVFPTGYKPQWLPKRIGRYWVSWQPGHLRWQGNRWEVAGGLVWASSWQPVTEPIKKKRAAEAEGNGSDPASRWVWYLLQYDSIRSEAEIYEREWDFYADDEPEPEEPGDETEFELVAEEDQLEALCAVPDLSQRVVAEVFGLAREVGRA